MLLYGAEVWAAVDRLINFFKCSCELPESFGGAWADCIQEVQLSMKWE